MINEQESKSVFKLGCAIVVIVLLIIPLLTVKELITHYFQDIKPEDFFTTEKGLSAVFMFFFTCLELVFWFVVLNSIRNYLKRLLVTFIVFMVSAIFLSSIIGGINNHYISLFVIVLIIGFQFYYLFFRGLKFKLPLKLINFFIKKDLSKLETFSFQTTNKTVKIQNPFAGIYVQGGAGTGKSESLLKPMIKQGIEQNFAYILYDFKGDLSVFEKELLELNNIYDSYTLNFREPLSSHRFNPLNPVFLDSSAAVFELSKTLFYNLSPGAIKQSNNYFLDEAINFFTALVIYLKNNHKQCCSIPHIISSFSQVQIDKMIPLISQDLEALPFIASLKNVLELGASKQLAGVVGTLQGNLAKFSSKELFWILSGNDFTPDINNPDDIKRLTIINNSVLPGFYGPLIAMIINVCLKNMNDQGKHKSVVYLDEAPTIYIPEFEQIPATARSNKIATVYACQDYMQIVDKYGREKAQTIISNLSSQFFGRTTNVESIKLISELFGKYEKRFETESRGVSTEIFDIGDMKKNRNTSESFQERYRVSSNELTSLDPGEFYAITSSLKGKQAFKQLPRIKRKKEEVVDSIRTLTYQASDSEIESNYLSIHNAVQRIFK